MRPGQFRYEDLTFIGSGTSGLKPGDRLYPLSKHHDEAWAEDIWEKSREVANLKRRQARRLNRKAPQ